MIRSFILIGLSSLSLRAQFDNLDRKSTRLNSSHGYISYAVFCLKKKKNIYRIDIDFQRAHKIVSVLDLLLQLLKKPDPGYTLVFSLILVHLAVFGLHLDRYTFFD